jgi:uncharacterized protein
MDAQLLDPRSYHAFGFGGEKQLFDRSTGAVAVLDEDFWRFMADVERGKEEMAESAGCNDTFQSVISALKSRGFFAYTPVNHQEQEELIERLWRHHPRRIQMLMAQGCNLGCRYCYAWRNGSNQKGTLMPWAIAKASVDHLVANSGKRTDLQVTFFGGEPLLNYPVIRQVVEYCRSLEASSDKRFTFELITNGTLLSKDVAEWIVSEKFLLFVSIDV